MPFVNVKLIKGVFTPDEKREMITKLTNTMVSIEGEAMRQVTWVTIEEVDSGDWGIGGHALTTQDVKDLQSAPVPCPPARAAPPSVEGRGARATWTWSHLGELTAQRGGSTS